MNSVLIILILIIIYICFSDKKENFTMKPCDKNINEIDYLSHMIPHHQVAVDISYILQKKTKWPIMQDLLRKLIWTQEYEIDFMKNMLKYFPNNLSYSDKIRNKYISIISDYIEPNKLNLTNTYCDPHFFDPKAHKNHLNNIDIDEDFYIKHMIPHHQVAVDMSKKLLNNTNNDFMITFCYRIIHNQQTEIIILNDLLKSGYRHKSELI